MWNSPWIGEIPREFLKFPQNLWNVPRISKMQLEFLKCTVDLWNAPKISDKTLFSWLMDRVFRRVMCNGEPFSPPEGVLSQNCFSTLSTLDIGSSFVYLFTFVIIQCSSWPSVHALFWTHFYASISLIFETFPKSKRLLVNDWW